MYGGTSRAVIGGLSGSRVDKQVALQQAAERDRAVARLREEIGTDAFNGFVALAECRYDVAIANARASRNSRNRDFELPGLWLGALTEADRRI